MTFRYKHLVWILAVLAGFSFDRLFWEKPGGINFFIFILLIILGGLIPIWLEKIHISWFSYGLLLPIAFFAWMTAIRAEPFTIATNVLITLSTLILLSITLLNGSWHKFRIRDHALNLFKFLLNSIIGGILFFTKITRSDTPSANAETKDLSDTNFEEPVTGAEAGASKVKRNRFIKKAAPYLRGILLAFPILAILTALLASADPVFNDRIQNLFSWFEIESLGEYAFRLFYSLTFAYLILSAYYFSIVESKKWLEKKQEERQPGSLLGSIEASIILGGINLLFLLFVILQFTYLFGGQKNITVEGFTYAEYARRGFSELLAVALISLVVFYVLSMITKRDSKAKQWSFSGLGLFLVGHVAIILASAFTRLTLYEAAYGFTRLRTLTHVFMIWTGMLLFGVAVLDLVKKVDRMPTLLILMIFGFGLSINLLNVDRFIVKQNVTRSMPSSDEYHAPELDTGYLYALSFDSISPLVAFYTNPDTPPKLQADIGGVLACRLATLDPSQIYPWTSWHYARAEAIEMLKAQSGVLEAYPVSEDNGLFVEVNGEIRPCNGYDL